MADKEIPLFAINKDDEYIPLKVDVGGRVIVAFHNGQEITMDDLVDRLKRVEDALADYELLQLPMEKEDGKDTEDDR